MRVVLDTNVLVSALHFGGRPRRLLEAILRGEHRLVTGPAILDELDAVLINTCGWERARSLAARSEVEALGDVVTPTDVPRVCRDADDDEVLAIAIAGGAERLVTGDADLLVLGAHRGVRILTVANFETQARHHNG